MGPRLFDMHTKDLTNFQIKESQVAVGDGLMPMRRIFETLIAIKYNGFVDLEYEVHGDDPMPGVIASFAYMRGVLAGMGYSTHAKGVLDCANSQTMPMQTQILRDRTKWLVLSFAFLATVINYLDRQTLSVMAPVLLEEFHISAQRYSYIVSAFMLAYTLTNGISGRLLDRLGTKAAMHGRLPGGRQQRCYAHSLPELSAWASSDSCSAWERRATIRPV